MLDKENNFQIIHDQFRTLKNWLQGMHSQCSRKYLNEYFFRFSHRNHSKSLFDKIYQRMMSEKMFHIKFGEPCDLDG